MTATNPLYTPPPSAGNLRKRIISAIILIPPILACVYIGGYIYIMLMCALLAVCAFEWFGITQHPLVLSSRLSTKQWQLVGALYLAACTSAIILLRDTDSGLFHCLFVAFTVWGTDIGAMFAGKAIGGPKLCPTVSPNKTWAGLLGGAFTSAMAAVGLFYAVDVPILSLPLSLALAISITVISQAGDLFESRLKRVFGVKDSGALIPGHGGALDRVDGLLPASLFYYIVILFMHAL